jgi:hypothetical protein
LEHGIANLKDISKIYIQPDQNTDRGREIMRSDVKLFILSMGQERNDKLQIAPDKPKILENEKSAVLLLHISPHDSGHMA